jgi:Protein of unknown function (DUF3499)
MRPGSISFFVVPRLCERPGCSAVATVTYGFDTSDLVVWLSPFESGDQARPYGTGILCRRHADALVVPRGWRVDDRREAVPRLFLAPATSPEPGGEASRPRGERRKPSGAAPVGDLFDATTEAETNDGTLEETKAIPWSPQMLDEVEQSDSHESDAPAKGGLLARAFGSKDRRERQ